MERVVKIWKPNTGTWEAIEPYALAKLDVVTIFEPNGIPVNNGQVYILLGRGLESAGSIWGFSCLPVEGCTYENCKGS